MGPDEAMQIILRESGKSLLIRSSRPAFMDAPALARYDHAASLTKRQRPARRCRRALQVGILPLWLCVAHFQA